ncbi:threonine dehydrogenase-like Zn-dependent dehydrogenase [Breoghania corrubedonensis]|uniref:Threonine dehydrogenase-like Zn-dependent dehydrogenase n=1 Tax=Breoghania corrubedonensis TaxID=665038 RepID=A0A2T5VFA2_9HYPH|nr:zinc-binding alcohol dehydrogenase [Breoghania corrubedonensis]PTW62441.1 threonine dehydrogenase-like Zn-dependent dehydrogenase [Breoghania corrubedonensis]
MAERNTFDGAQAEALWYIGPRCTAIRDETLGKLAPDHIRVETIASGISRGTESLVFAGEVPRAEWQRMRAPMQAGDFPFPVKYGYQSVGRVVSGPSAWFGRSVFVLHPHQTLFDAPVSAATPVPDAVPAKRAVLCGNMQTALTAVWDARPAPGDHISVVGGGVVGLLTAWLCAQIPATSVQLVDVNPARQAIARQLGFAFADPKSARGDNDLVIHASASEAGLETAFALAGDDATVLELSWYGENSIRVALGGAFHSRRLRLAASQVGRIPADHNARWDFARRNAAAMALLDDARLDALLEEPITFHTLPETLPRIFDKNSGVLCQVVDYGVA